MDRRRLVGREAQIRVHKLDVRGVDAAVVVDVGPRVVPRVAGRGAARRVEQGEVASVDLSVAIGVAGREQAQRVRAAAGAADAQRLQPRGIDAEEGVGVAVGVALNDRGGAVDLRQRRAQPRSRRRRDAHAEQERAALRQRDLAITHGERIEVGAAGRHRSGDVVIQIAQRGAEVGGHGAHRRAVAIGDGLAARRRAEQREPMWCRVRVGVALAAARIQVARGDQVALTVIGVGEAASFGVGDAGEAPRRILGEHDRRSARADDAAVADGEPHAVGIGDGGHAVGHCQLVARSAGVGQRVLRTLAGERPRVVGRAVVQRIEAAGGALQQHGRRLELPRDAGVGHPVRREVCEPGSAHLLGREGEADALAVGRADVHPRAVAQRPVDA